MKYDYAIIGGGIVGLSTGMFLSQHFPKAKIILLEKEKELASHQTGHNSGVIHSGIYYKPGSAKARFSNAGVESMIAFCRAHEIEHKICGKVIVATQADELARLEALYQRGLDNGTPVTKLTASEVAKFEPHVRCLSGIHVASTGIVNFRRVAHAYAKIMQNQGGEILNSTQVVKLKRRTDFSHVVVTNKGDFEADFIINCAGLYSDTIARMDGLLPEAKIVPFRGEYYELVPAKRDLVKGLIYPVPNPEFPFLGVHFTRMIDGSVHAGPNAVLALAREGYTKLNVNVKEAFEALSFPGFWKFALRHHKEGLSELTRSASKQLFLKSLQKMIPDISENDIVPAHAGVRAQALTWQGRFVDDFQIIEQPDSLHVCNAPSPAATCSLEIGKHIVEKVAARK